MALPKNMRTVTPTSKAFALALFIALPIMAFVLGAKWQKTPGYDCYWRTFCTRTFI